MSRPPQKTGKTEPRPRHQQFADGSAVVTYRDGSVLILESSLAKPTVLREPGPVNYNKPQQPVRVSRRRQK